MQSNRTSSKGEDDQNNSQKGFRFMDLPPKIRNEIYRHILEARNGIRISRHLNKANRGMNKYLQKGNRVGYVVHGITMSTDQRGKDRKRWVSEEHPLAVLRVSKVLNVEAAPVFYGANTFAFDAACALSEFKVRVGSNFRLLKDIHVKSVSTGGVKRLSIALCCLTLGTHVTVEGFLRGNHNLTIDRETGWVCNMLRPFIAQHWEWKPETRSSSGSYKMTRSTNEEERKQRFDSLHLVAKPGMKFMLKDGSILRADKDNDLHAFLKDGVLEKWEHIERENQEKAKECAERASKEKFKVNILTLKQLGWSGLSEQEPSG